MLPFSLGIMAGRFSKHSGLLEFPGHLSPPFRAKRDFLDAARRYSACLVGSLAHRVDSQSRGGCILQSASLCYHLYRPVERGLGLILQGVPQLADYVCVGRRLLDPRAGEGRYHAVLAHLNADSPHGTSNPRARGEVRGAANMDSWVTDQEDSGGGVIKP